MQIGKEFLIAYKFRCLPSVQDISVVILVYKPSILRLS